MRILFVLFSVWSLNASANFQSCFDSMMALVQPRAFDQRTYQFQPAPDLNTLEDQLGHESMFSVHQRLAGQDIKNHNLHLLTLLSNAPILDPELQGLKAITPAQTRVLYQAMTESNVYRNSHCYDRPGVSIGFCFGRATIVHTEALLRGVHPQAIKKIWIVGDMGHWGHHVATMIRGTDNNWYVIDDVTGIKSAQDWITRLQSMNNGAKEAMVFITQAERLGPYDARVYSRTDLFNTLDDQFERENDYYLGYFYDYFNWIDERAPVTPFQP